MLHHRHSCYCWQADNVSHINVLVSLYQSAHAYSAKERQFWARTKCNNVLMCPSFYGDELALKLSWSPTYVLNLCIISILTLQTTTVIAQHSTIHPQGALTCFVILRVNNDYYYSCYYYYSLSPLYRVFTIIYLIQTMFLGHTALQLFCIHNLWYM